MRWLDFFRRKIGPDPVVLEKALGALSEFAISKESTLLLATPLLLSPEWQRALRKACRPNAPGLFDFLRDITEYQQSRPWPLGYGPLDALFTRWKDGELSRAAAIEMATGEDLVWRLSADYVKRMAAVASHWAHNGRCEHGVLMAQLVLAAVDARRGSNSLEQAAMEFTATIQWLGVVTQVLCDAPDPALFHDALARGKKLADVIKDPLGNLPPADMLQALGVLCLDPYSAGRSTTAYREEHAAWLARRRTFHIDMDSIAATEGLVMPAPADALQQAASYLERAARYRSGVALGRTRKAQLQALVMGKVVGLTPDPKQLARIRVEARRTLVTPEVQGLRTEVETLLKWLTEADRGDGGHEAIGGMEAEVQTLLSTPADHWLKAMPDHEVISRYTQAASAIARQSPRRALELWNLAQHFVRSHALAPPPAFFQQGLFLLHRVYGPGALPPEVAALRAEFDRLCTSAEADDFTRAARILALAYEAIRRDQEQGFIGLAEAAARTDEQFAETYSELLKETRAHLLLGAAVNQFDLGDLETSAQFYMESVGAWLECGNPAMAMECVERVVDLGQRGSTEAIAVFIASMQVFAAPLENYNSENAGHLQALYRRVGALLVRERKMKLIVFVLFLQMAKGATFAQALQEGGPAGWLNSEQARVIEERLAELASQCSEREKPPPLDFEMVLTSYVRLQEQVGGATPQERLRNLRIDFDQKLSQAQFRQAPSDIWTTEKNALQNVLGEDSALLSIYFGHLESGEAAIFCLLLTREHIHFSHGYMEGWNSNLMEMGEREHRVFTSPFSIMLSELRRAIQADPLMRAVSSEAADALVHEHARFFGGGTLEQLRTLRAAGKSHLYVWPHGPYHFAPIHLYGPEDAPLANDWNVTYLSHLALLNPARRWDVSREPFRAIGVDFPENNGRGLAPLVDAEAEAQDISMLLGAPHALTGAALNKASVLDALKKHRRLHIATHGFLPVSTPSFQALYLSPELDGDVLYAYELQRLDLRGVDLVTLSACETALGRFDIGDNLRGFSATLLTSGVSTIIGTLWPIESSCSRYFFVCLYAALNDGLTKGAAFRKAQIQTRNMYHAYRDWGAFYLNGAID